MLNLKMKICTKYSNCRHESSAIGETLFTIMWRHKSNWSMNYPRTKYLTYMVKDCQYVSRSERRSFEVVYIFDYWNICTLHDTTPSMIYSKWYINLTLSCMNIEIRLSRVRLCTVLMPIKNVVSIQLWPIL